MVVGEFGGPIELGDDLVAVDQRLIEGLSCATAFQLGFPVQVVDDAAHADLRCDNRQQ